MTILRQKKKISNKTVRGIFCAVMYALLAIFMLGLFLFSANYSKIYGSPQVQDSAVNFEGIDIPSRDVACNLAGEWEFFYNEWIITDGYDGEPDGMIKLPAVWTYKNFGNGALPRTGFASYRLRADNVQAGINVIVYRHYSNFAFRVFINGELNYRSGELSKTVSETVVTGRTTEQHPYLTDGSPLEIVIEVSAMTVGGFHTAPWLAATSTGNSYGGNLRSFNYIALGIAASAVAVSILSFIFFRFKRDITVPAFMFALFAHFLCSRDMLYVIRWSIPTAMILQMLTAIVSFVLLVLHFWRSGAKLKKIPVLVSLLSAAVFTALTFAFYGTPLAPVFAFALFVVGCAFLVPIVFNEKLAPVQRYAYGVLFAFLMSVFCFELCDGLGLLVFGTEFIFTFELMLIIACFAVLWLWKLAKNARNAIRVSELECELSSVKNQALKAQIEPHFIYNSLTAIQARYRDGLHEGDKAIEQFAKHLRLITDSKGEDVIAFDDEVRNVLNYFELENLRADGKLNLLLDLDYTDFCVPALSLQPLVENAVKHGNLRGIQDGYISLSSERTESAIVITVADNGQGFDLDKVHTGVGLENARKRFELFGAQMKIKSAPNQGTQVTIEIPLE
ncbi:MAG: histidine kinase [Clostridia bacterium]|nr:histidine kinase [Clostridia bacterium]